MSRLLIPLLALAVGLAAGGWLQRNDLPRRVAEHFGWLGDAEVELTPFYWRTLKYQHRVTQNTLPGTVHFIGDSFVQGLAVSAVATPAVNFGIGGDTTLGMLRRIPEYPSLRSARAVVLAGGYNDLWRHDDDYIVANYRRILAALPKGVPVVLTALFPVNERIEPALAGKNRRIAGLNRRLAALCGGWPGCHFLDIGDRLRDGDGQLAAPYQAGDGLHLVGEGNAIWIRALRAVLTRVAPG